MYRTRSVFVGRSRRGLPNIKIEKEGTREREREREREGEGGREREREREAIYFLQSVAFSELFSKVKLQLAS